MKKTIIFATSFIFSPFVALAASCDKNSPDIKFDSVGHIINWASCTLIGFVVPLLFSLATVGFIWGIIQFFLNPDNEEARKKGKSYMIWGLLALFVMVSMWGLVGVLTKTFGIQTLIPQLSQ
jgi:hypothetical protein